MAVPRAEGASSLSAIFHLLEASIRLSAVYSLIPVLQLLLNFTWPRRFYLQNRQVGDRRKMQPNMLKIDVLQWYTTLLILAFI